MRDLGTLRIKPWGARPFPGFSVSRVRAFEDEFHLRLPETYIQFLMFANGGTLDTCEYEDPVTGGIGGINDFYGLGSREGDDKAALSGEWEIGNLWGETRVFVAKMLEGVGVPFARDGGGNRLFFDYRQTAQPISRFVAATRLTYPLTPTFESFLDTLRERKRMKDRGRDRK